MVEIVKNPINIDNVIYDKVVSKNNSIFNKISPYLFNIKIIISIIVIGICFFIKNKYYNKITSYKKETDCDLYDYIIMDKYNKIWKVSKDFFEKLNDSNNYNNVSSMLLNNIKSNNFKKIKQQHEKNDEDTSDIISDTIANNQ